MTAKELKTIIEKNGSTVAFGEIFKLMLYLYKDDEQIPDEVVEFAITERKERKPYFICGERLWNTINQRINDTL